MNGHNTDHKQNCFDKDAFPITYWYGPPSSVTSNAVYRQVKEAGFSIAGPMGVSKGTYRENIAFLDACAANGIKAIVLDGRISDCINGVQGWEETAAAIVSDYKNHEALYAYYIIDEPNTSLFPALGRVVAKLRELDPVHHGYINLFPNYATPEQLGSPTYYDHVKAYIEAVKPSFVSYDHYHFLNFPAESPEASQATDANVELTGDEREDMIRKSAMVNVDRGGFFDNLEDVRSLCLEYDIPFMVIILLIEHGPYRYLKESELRFEVFQSLAYGARYLSYFTYWTVIDEPDSWWQWKNAAIDTGGLVLQHYYDVQAVNHDLSQYGAILQNERSQRVSHVGDESERVIKWTQGGALLSIETDGRLTIGDFTGSHTAVCNKDINNSCAVTLTFGRETERFDTEERRWVSCGSKVCVTLAAGDMVLYRTKG